MRLGFNTSSNPLPAISFRSDSASSGGTYGKRLDANEVLFFENELNYFDPHEYEVIKNELSWLDIFSVRTIDQGLNTYTYSMYDSYGTSKFGANKATDIPSVSVAGKQFSSPIANIDCSMEFTAQDLQASAAARKDIVSRLRRQAMRSNFELMNKTCFEGYTPLKIPGLMSNEHITNKKSVAAVKSKTLWADKTPDEIYADLMEGFNSVIEKTKNNIRPNTLIMSSSSYEHIATRIFNTFSGVTVLQQVINMTNVKVKKVPELNGIFSGNTNGFVFFKNDPEFVEQIIPLLFDASTPQLVGWNYTVFCRSRYAGLIIRQPHMFAMRYGI